MIVYCHADFDKSAFNDRHNTHRHCEKILADFLAMTMSVWIDTH
ncbi:hypothetical protein [Helicobacter sp. T3_23-1056]